MHFERKRLMAIPDFQSIMLPLLKLCADGQEHTNREAIDALTQNFSLSEEEQKQLLPSGQLKRLDLDYFTEN
jgi:restriction system protein